MRYVAAQAKGTAIPTAGQGLSLAGAPEQAMLGSGGEQPGDLYQMLQSPHSLTEAELTKKLAEADAKKFAELLRNWLT